MFSPLKKKMMLPVFALASILTLYGCGKKEPEQKVAETPAKSAGAAKTAEPIKNRLHLSGSGG